MQFTSGHLRTPSHAAVSHAIAPDISCNWQNLRDQLMMQWSQITSADLDKTGPNPKRIAMLIENKYGIDCEMIENYLRNFERTMPLQ